MNNNVIYKDIYKRIYHLYTYIYRDSTQKINKNPELVVIKVSSGHCPCTDVISDIYFVFRFLSASSVSCGRFGF